jgi:hypothetical protein
MPNQLQAYLSEGMPLSIEAERTEIVRSEGYKCQKMAKKRQKMAGNWHRLPPTTLSYV